jgi:HD-like signal output (HDOD) protein/CheY-like chemotaxis protein
MATRTNAVIFLADTQQAHQLAARVGSDALTAVVAETTDALYQHTSYDRVDILVIENDLRSFLSGLDVLERLNKDLIRPATILLAQPTSEIRDRARSVGVEKIVAPDSTPADLAVAVNTLCANLQHAQLHICGEARRLAATCGDLRPLPQVVVKVASDFDVETVSTADLANDIATDFVLTAELLRLVNSSAVAVSRRMTNVVEAVNMLGIRRTVALILSSAIVSTQRKLVAAIPEPERVWYNRRSVLIASAAATFARHLEGVSPDTAYVLGLFQDVGILVLAGAHGARYLHLIRRVRDIGQLPLDVAEKQYLRITHAEVSAALLLRWGLPISMTSLVLAHHDPGASTERPTTEQRFLRVMRIGEAIADVADGQKPQRVHRLWQLLAEYGRIKSDVCKSCVSESVTRALESARLFTVPVPDDGVLDRMVRHVLAEPMPATDNPPVEADQSSPDLGLEIGDSTPATAGLSGDARAAVPVAGAQAGRSKPWVLIVEDEPMIAQVVSRSLADDDLPSGNCDSIGEALEQAPAASLILLDVHLRNEDGISAIGELRQRGYQGPIIVVSGDRTRETVGRAIIAGANDYLIKPFNSQTLLAKVRKHLGRTAPPPSEMTL